MKKLIETLRNIWKIKDLRERILYTLGLLLIFRIGTFIALPGVDPINLKAAIASGDGGGLLGLINSFAGGAFFRAGIFALGIMPYISASIVMQLLTLVVPQFQKIQKDGESGRKKIQQYTRFLTVIITAVQAVAYLTFLRGQPAGVLIEGVSPALFTFSTIVILVAGTLFVMWMGEKITDRGVGNGVSLLITVGIIATLPGALVNEFLAKAAGSGGGVLVFFIEMLLLMAVILATIALVQATRKIPVQYAKRMVGRAGKMAQVGGVRQFIPLKLNASGVMPIIFAQALMFIPGTLGGFLNLDQGNWFMRNMNNMEGGLYNVVLFLLVVLFTYFYTALIINPNQMADDMKKNGGFIPGVRPGKKTASFIENILDRVTLPGSLFLGLVSIFPAFAMIAGVNQNFAMFYGGTSLLIMVAVVLDTLQQIESHLLMRHYDGLMKTGKIKGRSRVGASM